MPIRKIKKGGEKRVKERCDMCGYETAYLFPYNGKYLCEQCLLGEEEAPEHQI